MSEPVGAGMTLTVVGCSGSLPGPDSPASCYLLTAHHAGRDWRVLLDLGSGAFGALQRHCDPLELDAVVLSHLHPDHCLDLTALHVMRQHGPRAADRPLPVHAPTGAAERMSRAYGVTEPQPMSGMTWHDLVAEETFVVGPFHITPYPVLHPVPAFGLRVQAGEAVVAYTGDTDMCAALSPLMAGADIVLSEAAFVEGRDQARGIHLTARRAAQAVVEAGGVRSLLLTHLPPWNDPQLSLEEARQILEPANWPGLLEVVTPDSTYLVGGAS